MKNIKITVLIFTVLIALTTGCKKMIEDGPVENANEDLVFDVTDSLGVYSGQFLNNIYSSLPNGFNRIGNNMLDAGSDDALPSSTVDIVQYYSNGAFNQTNIPDDTWDRNYRGIRKVNVFLANIDRVPLSQKGLKKQWKAEARALRAMFYFELIKRWGGVPIVNDKVFELNDKIDFPRNTYEDCVKYILSEIDAMMPDLLGANTAPENAISGPNFGRFNRGAAMALKARLLLYAASPLNNPGNDLQKWNAATKAAKDIMDSVAAAKFAFGLSTGVTAHYTTAQLAALAPAGTALTIILPVLISF